MAMMQWCGALARRVMMTEAIGHGIIIIILITVGIVGGADPMRTRGQENEEREEIQRIVRQREAEEGEEDRAHQGQG
ncbi:hypothetical protein L1049_015524 [Liquidambar formosana]|uniref:Uncharacterized protein n=1 Tax=Liquidambar formosana TaxID=63359 RepID=A0AAP0RZU9_LIQFO